MAAAYKQLQWNHAYACIRGFTVPAYMLQPYEWVHVYSMGATVWDLQHVSSVYVPKGDDAVFICGGLLKVRTLAKTHR